MLTNPPRLARPVPPARPASAALAAAVLFLGAALPTGAQSPDDDAPIFQAEDHAFRVVRVVDGLQDPWSVTWLPSG
ncbi:MAG: hypothetical protein ACLFWG_05980, partial [Longimicrobiales bacterium]